MKNTIRFCVLAAILFPGVGIADELTSAVHDAAVKTDSATKTVAVKAKDETKQTAHWTETAAVKSANATGNGAKAIYGGAKQGTDLVVHDTVKGTQKTDAEVKRLGKEGITSAEDATTKVGDASKTVATKTVSGTEHAAEVAGHGTGSAAVSVGKGAAKAEKATVHSVEEGSKKIAHVFAKH